MLKNIILVYNNINFKDIRPNKILGNKSKIKTIIILVLVIYKDLPDRGLF
jgi:hypothetical protein